MNHVKLAKNKHDNHPLLFIPSFGTDPLLHRVIASKKPCNVNNISSVSTRDFHFHRDVLGHL